VASNSLRVHSGGMGGVPGSERRREYVWSPPTANAVEGADVGRLSF